MAFDSIREMLSGFAKLGTDYAGTRQEAGLVEAIEQLRNRLSDHETRKKLLNLLPSLVSHLVIDTENSGIGPSTVVSLGLAGVGTLNDQQQ